MADDLHEGIIQFVLRAGLHGFGSGKPHIHDTKPYTKVVEYQEGILDYQDVWVTNPDSSVSTGTTTVRISGISVMTLQYGGWYDEEVLPFLGEAIRSSCVLKRWTYGRGPGIYTHSDHSHLVYTNRVLTASANHALGYERIIDLKKRGLRGEHNYMLYFLR